MSTLKVDEPAHQKSLSRNTEIWICSLVIVFALAIHLLILDPTFNGPDAISNFKFAEYGQDWGYWWNPDAFWGYQFPMGYGTFLALVAHVTGGSLVLAQYIQILLALAMAPLAWFITRHLGKTVRLVTFASIALSPSVFWLARSNGYEILISFFMIAAVAALWGLGGTPPVTRNKFQRALPTLAGISMALCMMCQGKTIIVIPVLLCLAWKWGRLQAGLFIVFSFSLPLLWSIRNHLVLDRWNPFNSSSDIVFWMGNNPTTKAGEYVISPPPLPSGFTSYYSAGLDFIFNQPERAYSLLLIRMARLIEPTYFYPDWSSVKGANVVFHLFMILLSVIGAALFMAYLMGRLWIRPPAIPAVGPIAILVVLFVLVHIPFATEVRHTKPIVPLALCVAMPTLIYLFRRIRSRKTFVSSDL
jgi:hypothetical protein